MILLSPLASCLERVPRDDLTDLDSLVGIEATAGVLENFPAAALARTSLAYQEIAVACRQKIVQLCNLCKVNTVLVPLRSRSRSRSRYPIRHKKCIGGMITLYITIHYIEPYN